MTALLITATIIFTSYVIYVWCKFGVLPSISDSFYKNNEKPLFTLAMFGTGLPITIYAEFGLLFFAGAFICLVGAAAAFREDLTAKAHVVGAIGGIILGLLSCLIDYHNWILPAIFINFAGLATVFKLKNITWWVEITALICIVITLFISS